jgi:enoyl-CoA hydratase/carnithine racemase
VAAEAREAVEDLLPAIGEPWLDADGVPQRPVVVVNLTSMRSLDLTGLVAAARHAPRVLIGLGDERSAELPAELLGALDLTLVPGRARRPETVGVDDPAAAALRLAAAVRAGPQAAVVLARLLRWSAGLPVADALDAESLAYSTLLGGPGFRRWLETRGSRREPPVVDEPVRLRRIDRCLHVTLDRPERRNAYGRQVRDGLVEALQLAALDPAVERVVIDGAGPCFCSGGDLDEFGTTPDVATAHLVRMSAGAALPMHRLAGRIEVRVHGSCVGAGVELPAFAERVLAREDTTFRLPEIGMGLLPGAGGTVSLPRRIGRWRTLYLALSGEAIGLDQALDWDLVDGRTDGG